MDELDESARELLELAREGDAPGPGDRERVRRGMAATLAGGAAAGLGAKTAAAAGLGSSSLAPAALSTGKIAMVLLSSLTAGAVATGVAVTAMDGGGPAAPGAGANPTLREVSRSTAPAPRPSAAVPGGHGADAPPAEALRQPPPEVTPAGRAPETAGAAAPPPPKRAASATRGIAEETRLLEAARAALSAGNGRQALSRADEHGRRFPSGVLRQEAEAVRILALCRLGRHDEARAAAAAFTASYPSSPQRDRLEKSCIGSDDE